MFAHFPVPAKELHALVPKGVQVQEFDGTSWVGVVPFRMEGVMPRLLPDLPGLSAFPELNLRLYVNVDGRPGVWCAAARPRAPRALPLQRAEADIEENSLAGALGIELTGPPALLHFSRRLDVVVWNVEQVVQ